MARSIHLDLPDDQAEALDRVAAILRKNPDEAGALLMAEALRHEQFQHVEFRDSAVGRQAYVVGSSLAVWEVVLVAESYGMDPAQTASHLRWPSSRVETVLAYARAYPEEIAQALAENRAVTPDDVRRLLPDARWA
jgi:hypothetical protein